MNIFFLDNKILFKRTRNSIVILFLCILFFFIFALPSFAQQTIIDKAKQSCGGWLPSTCDFVIAFGQFFVSFASFVWAIMQKCAELASLALNPQNLFGGQGFLNADIVSLGWGITLNLANSFFALFLLIIAFATIFRIESHGIKQLLPKLIIAALFINFSLAIAGTLIDGSQILSNYFIDKTGGKAIGAKATKQLGMRPPSVGDKTVYTCDVATVWTSSSSMSVNKWTGPIDDKDGCNNFCSANYNFSCTATSINNLTVSDGLDTSALVWVAVKASIIEIVFGLLAIFIFLALAGMFIVRILSLWTLLILSPIVWLFWILPATEKYWHDWWESFLKWIFFAPAASFFLYLGLKVGVGLSAITENANALSNLDISLFSLSAIAKFVVSGGLMFTSIVVAQKMGLAGADTAMKFAKGGFSKVTGWTAATRYKDAIKDQFKKREDEKKDIAKGRVESVRKYLVGDKGKGAPGVWGFGGLKTPKEKQKEIALAREKEAESIVEKVRNNPELFDQVRKEASRRFGRTKPGFSRSASALALSKLERPEEEKEVITGYEEILSDIIDPKTNQPIMKRVPITKKRKKTSEEIEEEIKEFRKKHNYTKRQKRKVVSIDRTQKRQMGEKSKAEKMWEDVVKAAKESEGEEKPKTEGKKT